MAKIKEVTFSYKKGLPNFSSVNTFITAVIEPKDKLDKVWEELREMAKKEANIDVKDPDWVSEVSDDAFLKAEAKQKAISRRIEAKL